MTTKKIDLSKKIISHSVKKGRKIERTEHTDPLTVGEFYNRQMAGEDSTLPRILSINHQTGEVTFDTEAKASIQIVFEQDKPAEQQTKKEPRPKRIKVVKLHKDGTAKEK